MKDAPTGHTTRKPATRILPHPPPSWAWTHRQGYSTVCPQAVPAVLLQGPRKVWRYPVHQQTQGFGTGIAQNPSGSLFPTLVGGISERRSPWLRKTNFPWRRLTTGEAPAKLLRGQLKQRFAPWSIPGPCGRRQGWKTGLHWNDSSEVKHLWFSGPRGISFFSWHEQAGLL